MTVFDSGACTSGGPAQGLAQTQWQEVRPTGAPCHWEEQQVLGFKGLGSGPGSVGDSQRRPTWMGFVGAGAGRGAECSASSRVPERSGRTCVSGLARKGQGLGWGAGWRGGREAWVMALTLPGEREENLS